MKRALIVVMLACAAVSFTAPAATAAQEQPAQQAEKSNLAVSDFGQAFQKAMSDSSGLSKPVKVVLLLTALTFLPALLILTTAFTRIVIVLAFIRRALTTRQIPPAPVIIGLALFLSLFVMAPTFQKVNKKAVTPYLQGQVTAPTAVEQGLGPIRQFMLRQTHTEELQLYVSMSEMEQPDKPKDLPLHVLIPAFVTGELKKAFELGFVLYLPFLVLDLVVASILLSMGMMMLPPVIVSAPLKILLFVLVDGWTLIAQSLVFSFGGG
ncbi:MAG: flagellar type III secretion system pore protein FliP [Planctomycetota bacterium]